MPFWPLGLPRWDDPWVALGLRAPGTSRLAVWRRGPADAAGPAAVTLPVPHLRGARVTPRVLYPSHAGAGASWDATAGTLTVTLPGVPVRLRPASRGLVTVP